MSAISNNNYFYSASTIRSALERAISSVSENIACYSSDPVSDFTRNRKHSCSNLIYYILLLTSMTYRLLLPSLSSAASADRKPLKECFRCSLLTLQTIRHTMATIFLHAMVLISTSLTIQRTRRHIISIHLRPEDTISSISMHFMMY